MLALIAGCVPGNLAFAQVISLVVPAPPGGRSEAFAKALKALIESRRLARSVQIHNRSAGDGRLALVEFAGTRQPNDLMVTGPGLVAVAAMNRASALIGTTSPLARLAGEWQVLVVPKDSRFRTFDELASSLLRDPSNPRLAGQGTGGPDHVLYGLIAQGLGVDARLLDYVGFADSAQVVTAMLDGRVAIGLGSCTELGGQIRAGRLRPLAVSSSQRLSGLDAPTLMESGVRLEYANWKGLLGPGMLSERERAALLDLCRLIGDGPGWQEACTRNGWASMYLAGDDFQQWLTNETRRTKAVLKDLGLL
jgi:putative tricarboxylic transport membrane protein